MNYHKPQDSVQVTDRYGTHAQSQTNTPITNPVPFLNLAINEVAAEPISLDKFQIHFETNSSEIKNESKEKLREILHTLKSRNANKKLRIVGFADHRGTLNYNHKLSNKRAYSVKNWLKRSGFPEKNLKAFGAGETYQQDLSKARVVEIHLIR